tara:strand:+ start:428 stop:616 length:189 start_codon:yes stop_codon:yes gene_type:complete
MIDGAAIMRPVRVEARVDMVGSPEIDVDVLFQMERGWCVLHPPPQVHQVKEAAGRQFRCAIN